MAVIMYDSRITVKDSPTITSEPKIASIVFAVSSVYVNIIC